MDYLEKKGHSPVKNLTGGRLSYLCPMPWHAESKPSFVVYTNSDYENFYCFGCQSKHNIIHLVSFLDNMPVKKAIELLSDGFEFSLADEEKLAQEQMLKVVDERSGKSPTDEVSGTVMEVSGICQAFLRSVDNDQKEVERIDKVWEVVDASLRDYDFEKIEKIRKEIGPLLLNQKSVFRDEQEEKLRV